MQNSEFRIQNYLKSVILAFTRMTTTSHMRFGTSEKGFAPILVIGVVVLLALFLFLYFFFMQNNKQLENYVSSDIPPGVVVDAEGNICETQDPEFCHESEDIETWKDDGLP